MKIHPLPLIITIFLASFLQISFAFTCSDLSENQCSQLKTDGCTWSGSICSGSYSPSCIPPSCYYIDSNSQNTATPDGTPANPLKTLSDGFTKISGKDGFLIIVNILNDTSVGVTKASTISSNITIKPLFESQQCTIDFTQIPSSLLLVLTVKKTLKVMGTHLGLQFSGSGAAYIFSVSSGAELCFENVEVQNASNTDYVINLVRTTSSTFSMLNCKFTDTSVIFTGSGTSTITWKNVYGGGQNFLRTTLDSVKTMTLQNCFFTGGLGSGFLSVASGSEVLVKNCTFKDLTYSPLFTINSVVKMTIEDCIFDNIFYSSWKMLVFQQGTSLYGVPSVIKNTSFTNIAVQTSLLYLEGRTVNLSLVNVTMKNITQQQNLPITSGYSSDQTTLPLGLCCSAVRSAQLSVESSNFSEIGSHCFGLRDTIFTLKSSTFDNSELLGSEKDSIVKEDVESLDDKSGVSWIAIEGTSYFYGDIYKILIQNNKFIKNGLLSKSGGAIRFTGIKESQIIVTGNEFIGNQAYYGGAVYAENILASLIPLDNNTFVDNSAYHGGAVYKIDESSFDTLSGASVSIMNSQLIGNKAVKNGGALYLYRDSLWISNTEFTSNQATNGGALYYINLDEKNNEVYGGLRNVSFIQNSASNAGGAMKLFFEYSQLKTDATIFENNFDTKQQAINQGRPSYYLLSFYDLKILNQLANNGNLEDLVKDSELTRLSFTVNSSESSATEIKFKSGNELAQILQVQIFDNENKIADYVDDEEIVLEMVSSQNNNSDYSASLVSSPVSFTVSNGIGCPYYLKLTLNSQGQFFAKSDVKMYGEPKTTATLQLSNVEGSSNFIQDSGMEGSFDLQVYFVDCDIGDIFESSTKSCVTCAEGSYSFDDPYQASHCNKCPDGISCYGGNLVGPKSGYWMANPSSLITFKCPHTSACLGGYVDFKYFPNGKCFSPHQGNLCNQCAPKFAKFGSSTKCEDCKNTLEYYLRFGLFLVLQVAIILGVLKLSEKQDANQTFYLNIIKIFINFIQINSIILNYNLELSTLSKDFLHVVNRFIPVNHDGFAIDCFISLVLPDNQNLIFVKLIVTCFQPLIIWGLSILAYFLILSSSPQSEPPQKKLKAALGSLFIITAFLVQPNIILTCLDLFSCQNLGSAGSFLTSDSEVECWTGSHLIWSFGVALPLLLIWAVLLPVVLFFKTRRYSKETSWQPFFYQGLEKTKFCWEFLMLFAKTLIIIVFTILTIIQTEIQILATFFVCITLTVLFLRLRPYVDPRLHYLNLLSLTTLALASYIGFFSFTDNWMDTQMTICSVLLVVTNCGLFFLPAFYIIKDYIKPNSQESPTNNQAAAEDQRQTEAEKFSATEKEQQKQIMIPTLEESEKVVKKNDDKRNEDIEVCNELNQEMKIGKIVHHTKKESIDNFSIMQSSGVGLLSPLQTSSTRLISPLPTSPTLTKQFTFSPISKDNPVMQGDFMQKTVKKKKINSTRINMKQFVMNELEVKNTETEKTTIETGRTETTEAIPTTRTQAETEEENLLSALNIYKIDSKRTSTDL